jgi:type I restriction enzyme S subunit
MSSKIQMIRLDEIAKINPARKVLKGKKVDFVDMAALPQNSRDIIKVNIDQRIAKGAGAHFRNYDTLLARITPCLENGKTAQVRCLEDDAIAEGSTEFIVLCGIDEKDNDFIYYLCRDSEFRKYAIGRMEGTSGRQRVSWQSIAAYQFQCPEQAVRVRNSKVLTLLDDRITLLRETNLTLEAIAQAIFKSWFVDFDPVRAKLEGRQPEGMDQATASLFPDSFEQSELGVLPKGWNIGNLGDIFTLRNDRTKPSNQTFLLPYVPTESIDSKTLFLNTFKYGDEAKSSLILFNEGDVLFGAMRPYFHKVCLAPFNGVTRTTVFTLTPKDHLSTAFALLQAFQEQTVNYATKHSEGSTIPYAKWKNSLEKMTIVIPNQGLQRKFSDIVMPLIKSGNENCSRSRTLANLRDSLLPRLISGQLNLTDAEEQIETALA